MNLMVYSIFTFVKLLMAYLVQVQVKNLMIIKMIEDHINFCGKTVHWSE